MFLRLSKLSYIYPNSDQPIFQNLNWELEGPGFFSLFGFSGVGKSTLAKIVSGDINDYTGLRTVSDSTTLYSHNNERIPGWQTISEHISQVIPPQKAGLCREIAERFAITANMDRRFGRLSMGQKNRVNVLRYILQDFDLLIGDEILANVDEPTRNLILLEIKKLFPDKTFLYISHNALEVVKFSKTIFILPQTPDGVITKVLSISGLDEQTGNEANPREVERRVFSLLKMAGSGGSS